MSVYNSLATGHWYKCMYNYYRQSCNIGLQKLTLHHVLNSLNKYLMRIVVVWQAKLVVAQARSFSIIVRSRYLYWHKYLFLNWITTPCLRQHVKNPVIDRCSWQENYPLALNYSTFISHSLIFRTHKVLNRLKHCALKNYRL